VQTKIAKVISAIPEPIAVLYNSEIYFVAPSKKVFCQTIGQSSVVTGYKDLREVLDAYDTAVPIYAGETIQITFNS